MNARSIAGMEEHPDIMELRARYELAAAAPLAQFANGLIFLTGLYLAISPWVVGFNASMRSLAGCQRPDHRRSTGLDRAPAWRPLMAVRTAWPG